MTLDLNYFKNYFTGELSTMNHTIDGVMISESLTKGDEVDQALNTRDFELGLKLKGRNAFYRKKIKDALERIENGEFGICEECGEEIGEKRLLARPTATCCVSCKEEMERAEDHIPYQKRSHTQGKGFVRRASNVIEMKPKIMDAKEALALVR